MKSVRVLPVVLVIPLISLLASCGGSGGPGRPARNAALTVEPGLYVPPGARRARKEFRGLGVRIEDDVLITRGSADVLTGALVKDPDAIERFLAAA